MKQKAKRKKRRARAGAGKAKATTLRLEPGIRRRLMVLKSVRQRPMNVLLNEAVELYVETQTSQVENQLEAALARVREARKADPGFSKTVARLIDAEARYGAEDPAEGKTKTSATARRGARASSVE